jgi:hypothetical protein
MSDYLNVPGFPGVRASIWSGPSDGFVTIKFMGSAEDLVRAGVATAEMVTRGERRRKGPRKRRVDADGHKYWREHYWATGPDGEPVTRWAVARRVPVAKALQMPCGRELLEESQKETLTYDAWRRANTPAAAPQVRQSNVIDFAQRFRKVRGTDATVAAMAALIVRGESQDD